MKTEVEVSKLDRKHEGHRMKSATREKQLLALIVEQGIAEPLQGVLTESGQAILLDGFKRLRSAIKIGMGSVPFISLGEDEATAILTLIRTSNAKMLTLLEQAAFVEDLKRVHGLSVAEIATRLQKSKGWVVVRLQTLSEMGQTTHREILAGRFPLYSYLYTLHPFRRLVGSASKKEVDEFVGIASGKGLSTRDIELLSGAYFRGGDQMREQLKSGDLGWCLQELKERNRIQGEGSAELSDVEKRCLRDLEILHGCMGRLSLKLGHPDIEKDKPAFIVQAEFLADGVLSRIDRFVVVLRGFYDRIRKT